MSAATVEEDFANCEWRQLIWLTDSQFNRCKGFTMQMTVAFRRLLVAVAFGVLAGSVNAQPPGRSGDGPAGGPGRLFDIFDADDDGALTEDEVPGPVWVRLSAADANEDGAVSQDEIASGRSARSENGGKNNGRGDAEAGGRPQGPPWASARGMFQRFDDDRDGALTKDETPAPAWKYLSRADADEDGAVTQEEVIVLVVARVFIRFDENEDGFLTADELPEMLWDRLGAADADESDTVSLDEIVDAILSAPRGGRPKDDPAAR